MSMLHGGEPLLLLLLRSTIVYTPSSSAKRATATPLAEDNVQHERQKHAKQATAAQQFTHLMSR
jgi:hypothetical protein